jgi:Transglycosylase SLT domain
MHTEATSLSDAPEHSTLTSTGEGTAIDELPGESLTELESASGAALMEGEPPYVAEEEESAALTTAELRESIAGAIASLPGAIGGAVRSGAITLQVGVAIASGERDENKLTNLIFYGRHPELPSDYRIQSGDTRLVSDWTSIRDGIVRPLLRSLSGAPPATASPTPATPARAAGISTQVVSRIDGHREVIERAAAGSGVNANILRGIIAAESGGNANTGAGGSGYKGLMQSDRTEEDLDPAVSTRKGARKFVDFSQSMRRYFHDSLKQDFDALAEETRVRIVMAAYNAGPVTVKRAMATARAAGDVTRWLAPEHYLRALVSTGAYNPVPAVIRWCLERGELSIDDVASDLARATGKAIDDLRRTYAPSGTWNGNTLSAALSPYLFREKNAMRNDGGTTWDAAQARASKSLLCAVRFKQANTGGYLDTIIRYKNYYDRR